MHEKCATCHGDYPVTPDNARLALFIGYPLANHLVAACHCGATEIIYVGVKTIVALMETGAFKIVFNDQPTPERREAANYTWGTARRNAGGASLPQPPREWLRQLHDDLRAFGNGGAEQAHDDHDVTPSTPR